MTKKTFASCLVSRSGLGRLIRRASGQHGFIVLNYHRVGNLEGQLHDRGLWSASADGFEKQLRFLKTECDVVEPQDIADLPSRGRGHYAMITFDDGYRDNYEVAFPLLSSAGLKAVFFLATGFLDAPRLPWWDEIAWMVHSSKRSGVAPTPELPLRLCFDGDRQQAIGQLLWLYKKLPSDAAEVLMDDLAQATGSGRAPVSLAKATWMTWDMIRQMRQAGMTIGGHTVNHPILANLPRFEQEREITGCAKRIEEELHEPMRCFSYPRGKPDAFTDETRACLYEARVEWAFSYYGGRNHLGHNRVDLLDHFDIKRLAVEADMPIERFEAMVTLPQVFA